jgi:ribosomal protein L12E/L44/L45/RPP1/RPP2
MRYIVIDYTLRFSFECDNMDEVIEALGYELDEITFEELLEKVKGEYEIGIIGSIERLN